MASPIRKNIPPPTRKFNGRTPSGERPRPQSQTPPVQAAHFEKAVPSCPSCLPPSALQSRSCPRSGFLVFQCRHPSLSPPPLCVLCGWNPSRPPSVSPRAGRPRSQCFTGSRTFPCRYLSFVAGNSHVFFPRKFFPIVGKTPFFRWAARLCKIRAGGGKCERKSFPILGKSGEGRGGRAG